MANNYLLENETSERLCFRKLLHSDFDDWLPFHQDPRSSAYWEGLPSNPKIACTEQFNRVFERYELGLGGMNALVHKTSNSLIGMCGLLVQEVDGIEELEIGYSILPNFWNQGYASEAAQRCKYFAKVHKLSETLISIIHIGNLTSQKVALKNGMQLDKTTRYKENPVHIFRIQL